MFIKLIGCELQQRGAIKGDEWPQRVLPLGQPWGQAGALRAWLLQSPGTTATLPGSPSSTLSRLCCPREALPPKGAGMLHQSLAVLHPAETPPWLLMDPKTTALPRHSHKVPTTLHLPTRASPAARILSTNPGLPVPSSPCSRRPFQPYKQCSMHRSS